MKQWSKRESIKAKENAHYGKIQCVIDSITFRDEKNGYTVVRVSSSDDSFIAVGVMPAVRVGSVFNLYGSWKVHQRFGYEFAFQDCEETLPATIEGIKNYLASALIKGIGLSYAEKIVDRFGEATLDILDNEPDRLSEIRVIGPRKLEKIKKCWLSKKKSGTLCSSLSLTMSLPPWPQRFSSNMALSLSRP